MWNLTSFTSVAIAPSLHCEGSSLVAHSSPHRRVISGPSPECKSNPPCQHPNSPTHLEPLDTDTHGSPEPQPQPQPQQPPAPPSPALPHTYLEQTEDIITLHAKVSSSGNGAHARLKLYEKETKARKRQPIGRVSSTSPARSGGGREGHGDRGEKH
ncbi:hypothetical protein O3P69_020225 [Scylla paramamosain]|uniref:Uncharacterized protein n=1 Tax=Scylla paramamosain TaxID=85552 RepID=A0AAW0TLU4_SCYPA